MKKSFDLAAALESRAAHTNVELSLAELVRAYAACHADENDLRLRKWVEVFGNKSAWALTAEELETAASALVEQGFAKSSANRDLSALGSVYKWAKAKRMSPKGFTSPTMSIARFDEPIRRVEVEPQKLEALKQRALATKDKRFGVFVSLLIDTGARKSELLERRWSEVDLERREILAPTTKNGKPRTLFFTEATAALIARVYPVRLPGQLIFEGQVPGQPVSFRKSWATAASDVGLPDLHMHDVRHLAAARLLRSGITLPVAAQVLGHDPGVLARRYGHLESAHLRQAQERSWATL